jgi:hypothetical protein
MLARTTSWQAEGEVFEVPEGFCEDVEVEHTPATRISALLGPDGEPLQVGYARPKVGFDLTPGGRQ